MSFNKSKIGYNWGGFSLKWYESLLNNQAMLDAFWHSIVLGLVATTVSTIIGILTALALHHYDFRGKGLLNGLLFVLMVSPEIVLAISLLALFLLIGLPLRIYSMVRVGLKPEVNAIGTILLVASLILVVISQLLLRRR